MINEEYTFTPSFFKRRPLAVRLLFSLLTGLCWFGVQHAFTQTTSFNPTLLDKFSRYQRYTMEQGLSNNSVTSIAQDDDGFLWLGTEEGLNRFDGERFASFFHRADGLPVAGAVKKNQGLPVDRITRLLYLPGQRLLIGTEKGLCALHTRLLEFEDVILPIRPEAKQADVHIWRLHRARDGQIWVGTNTGVYLLNDQLQVVQSYLKPAQYGEAPGTTFALDFLELPDGTIAVKFSQPAPPYYALWQVIDFQRQKTTPLAQHLPGCGVLDTALHADCVVWDGQHGIWYTAMGTGSPVSLYHFDWATRSTKPLLTNTYKRPQEPRLGQYNRPILLPDSLLLLQRYFGPPLLYHLRDGSTADLPAWKTSAPDGKGIINFVDRDGNLWLCPRFEGVYLLTLKNLPAVPMTALNAAHKKMMLVTGVSEEWFGFTGIEHAGRWVVSSGNGGLYSLDKAGRGVTGPVFDNPFRGYAYVYDFAPDRGDTLWTTTLGGLHWYDPTEQHQRTTPGTLPGSGFSG